MASTSPLRSVASLDRLGPGVVTGAADDDPSGIATYSQAGATFGYSLLWTMVLTFPLMTAVQIVSARIGRVTGKGLARNLRETIPGWAVTLLTALLFFANTINIGADLAAMGAAAKLAIGGYSHVYTVGFALLCLLLQMFISYKRYSNVLKWLTMALFAYVAVLFFIKLDAGSIARGLFIPAVRNSDAVVMIVAIFGTTISPYLFFWQSAQEVELVDQDDAARPLIEAPSQARSELKRIRWDTFLGMAVSNIVALAIMVSTAATLNASGAGQIETAAQAAKALQPIAGNLAFALFSLGIIGTGLLAVPVLAGSAAYAVGEGRGWKCGLDHKPWEAIGFYGIIALATLLGVAVDLSDLDPIKALFWSAVINGVVAVPIMAAMMVVVSRASIMGRFIASPRLRFFGWTATAVMAAAALAMAIF